MIARYAYRSAQANAIYGESELPAGQRYFIKLNAELASNVDWKPITRSTAPLPNPKMWRLALNKLAILEEGMFRQNK